TFDLSLIGDTDTNGVSADYHGSTDVSTCAPTTVSQTTLADGDYRFRAVVTDPAGNSSTSNVIEVVVDNTAPVAGTRSFAAGTLTDTGSSQTPAITQGRTFDLSLSGDTDTNGVSVAYQVSTDGITWSPTTVSQTPLAYPTRRSSDLVTDPAGNSSTSNVIEVVVDNTAPVAGTLSFAAGTLTDTGSSQSPAITQDGTFDLSLSEVGRASGRGGA